MSTTLKMPRALSLLRPIRPSQPSFLLRPFCTHPALRAGKDPHRQRDAQQDRNQINTESNEYSKSGTDAETANQDKAAFDGNISDPQEAKKEAGKGNQFNPLDASPANPELGKPSEKEEGKGESERKQEY